MPRDGLRWDPDNRRASAELEEARGLKRLKRGDSVMWVKGGNRRLWVGRHRDLGLVVYDPHRSEASPPAVLLFVHDKGALKSFNRLALRARGLWTRPHSLDVSAALARYARSASSVNEGEDEGVDTDWTDFLEPWHEFDPNTGLVVEVEERDPQDAVRAEWWSDVLEFDAYVRGEDPVD